MKQSTARTLVIHPFRNGPAVEATSINTLSIRETFAEKFRAAMTRREPAIRNFYDIDHVVTAGFLSIDDEQLLALAGQKLAVPGNAPVDVSDSKLTELGRQLSGQLRPVLRSDDFEQFDLQRAFKTVQEFASRL